MPARVFRAGLAERHQLVRKPGPGARVDWNHPIARGLVACWIQNENGGLRVLDLANASQGGPANGTLTPTAASGLWQPSQAGLGLFFNGAVPLAGVNFGTPTKLQFTQAQSFSIFSVFTVKGGAAAFRHMLESDAAPATRSLIIFRLSNTNVLEFAFGNTGGTIADVFGATAVAADSKVHTGCAVRDTSITNVKIYLDGVQDVSAADPSTGVWTTTNQWEEGFSQNSSGFPWFGDLSVHYVFNRALSAVEVKALHQNPYLFIIPATPRSRWMPLLQLTLARDALLPVEYRGLATLARDAFLPVEYQGLAALLHDALLPVDWKGSLVHDERLPVDWRGSLGVRDAQLPVEFTGILSDVLLHRWKDLVKLNAPFLHAWQVHALPQLFPLRHQWNVKENPFPPLIHVWNVVGDIYTPFGFAPTTGDVLPRVTGPAPGDIQRPTTVKDKTP